MNDNIINKKNHLGFFIFFAAIILVFLWDIIVMRSLFIGGDNFVQFYPWFKVYAESIKSFRFPFWCRYMQSGFPLMAEGQVGGYYPLNLLFFLIFPFKFAYNYSVVFHFILGGVSIYFLTRRLGGCEWGGALSALIFCFGSAYAGCFYNIITLRTLAWFGLILFLFESYLRRQRLFFIFFAGVILGFQFLAGFIQMALYSMIFYIIYFFYRAISEKIFFKKIFSSMLVFVAVALIVSLPQILLTSELLRSSGRGRAGLEFALWGSFSPLGFLNLVFPYTALFMKSCLYIGILSLFFVMVSLQYLKSERSLKAILLIFLVSIFFALGKYNPVYIMVLKLSGLYGLRNPSKFLFFAGFSLSVMAGWGFSRFYENYDERRIKRASILFKYLILFCGILFVVLRGSIIFFKKEILSLGYWYAKNFVFNKPYHRYSLSTYLDKVDAFYKELSARVSFLDIFVILSWALFFIILAMLPFIIKRRYKLLLFSIIFIDIYIFSYYGIGFRGNIRRFDILKPSHPVILERIASDQSIFRILPFGIASERLPNWALPNANITYTIDSIASYTPLAIKTYKRILSSLEVVDDSLGLDLPEEKPLLENLNSLKMLNVKYIVSYISLNYDALELLEEENGIFLYRLKEYFPRVFFTYDISENIRPVPVKRLDILRYESGYLEAEIYTTKEGYLIFSESFYPGWSVYIDGKPSRIIPIKDIIQAVIIPTGRHRVIFRFRPKFL